MNAQEIQKAYGEPVAQIPNHTVQFEYRGGTEISGHWQQHDLLRIPGAYKLLEKQGQQNAPVIAVLDTGAPLPCDGGIIPIRMVSSYPTSTPVDRNGHGTHCLSIAGHQTGQDRFPFGVCPWAKMVSVKVLSDEGAGADSWIANGVKMACDFGADIISMSMGGPQPLPLTEKAMQIAESLGVIICVAAGNEGSGPDGSSRVGFPARYETCWSIAALTHEGKVAQFSSVGPEVDTAAVGSFVRAQYLGCRVGVLSGTSMACPQFAGVVGLLTTAKRIARKNPMVRITGSELVELTRKFCTDIPPQGKDPASGVGYLNCEAAVAYILAGNLGGGGDDPKPGKPRPSPTDIELAGAFKNWAQQFDWSE